MPERWNVILVIDCFLQEEIPQVQITDFDTGTLIKVKAERLVLKLPHGCCYNSSHLFIVQARSFF